MSKADGAVEDSVRLVEQTILDVSVGLHPGMTTLPHLQTLTIVGPMQPSGVSDTPSRRHILTCTPATAAEETACATEIVTTLARRAFRRPPTSDDIDGLMQMYAVGREGGAFEDGIRTAAQTAIARPEFIFRFERVPESVAAGQSFRVHDLELASRLSYFLWGAGPDDALIAAADKGELTRPGRARAPGQADARRSPRREPVDPLRGAVAAAHRARRGPSRADDLPRLHPQPGPVDAARSGAAVRQHRARGPQHRRPAHGRLHLRDETLARHYGIPNVAGPQFRRVTLTDPNRFGLTGRGAILTMTSLANRTSPVARGKYVLEVLLGAPPPLPPANVPPLTETVNNERVLTVRERMEEHRKNPTCAGCHKIMDPIGLALENFDAIGRWRANDGGMPVDPRGEMYDGRDARWSGRACARRWSSHADAFRAGFAENLLSYALGRVLDTATCRRCAPSRARARATRTASRRSCWRSSRAAPFQMRTLASETETPSARDAKGVS